jgi:stage IV sporulation protein FB
VLFQEPAKTPLDLKFRLFRIPVRVHPAFWLVALLLGFYFARHRFEYVPLWGALAVWTGWLFLSVLIHEFGHITMGRMYGGRGHIVLYSFGGLAVGAPQVPRRWQRIAVFLAGPGAGFLFFGLIVLVRNYGLPRVPQEAFINHPQLREIVVESLYMLWLMNLVLNALNLVPIWPLDGGQVMTEIFCWIFPQRGKRLAMGFSFLLAAGVAVYVIMYWNKP